MDLAKRNLIDIQQYIEFLEENNHLIRLKSEVDSYLELAGIAKKYEGDKTILFEKVKDRDYPVLIGLYWNRDMMGKIFNTSSADLPFAIANDIRAWRQSPMEPVTVKKGPANEIIEAEPDLYTLPLNYLGSYVITLCLECCSNIF
ncbi:MAG: hypothetical protein V3V73_02800 [Gammaproteobacteria bacterium]